MKKGAAEAKWNADFIGKLFVHAEIIFAAAKITNIFYEKAVLSGSEAGGFAPQ